MSMPYASQRPEASSCGPVGAQAICRRRGHPLLLLIMRRAPLTYGCDQTEKQFGQTDHNVPHHFSDHGQQAEDKFHDGIAPLYFSETALTAPNAASTRRLLNRSAVHRG